MAREKGVVSVASGARTFVGREREFAELTAGLDDALAGRGGLFLIVGEPGIGKTRLADELCSVAHARGAQAWWGRCWEDGGAPAYWPWVQILRGVLRGDPQLQRVVAAETALIAQFIPEFGSHPPPPGEPPPTLDPEQARFPLFDAVTKALMHAAAQRPLLVVLDDLHAADRPSLLLLEFLARQSRAAPLLLIGTYRAVDVERRPERAQILAAVARYGHRLPLAGLSEAEVARLIASAYAGNAAPELVAAVYRTTEGNPFFIDEVVRLLIAEHGAHADAAGTLQIPHGVREAIRERLRPLSTTCREVLAVAAIIGREFDVACLERARTLPPDALFAALSEATTARIVAPVGPLLTRYTFAHALFRETLYDEVPPAQRLRLHRLIGTAIEELYAHDLDPHVAELAHHFVQASASGEVERAVVYATKAGDRAAAQLAYEDATVHYEQALQLAPAPDARRCELLIALGRVQRASSNAAARATFERAADLARRMVQAGTADAAPLLANAALGFADRGLGTPQLAPDRAVVGAVEEALDALGNADSALRARLLGRLAMELSFAEDGNQGMLLSQQAVDIARRLGHAPTLAATLSNRQFVLWRVDNIADRVSISSEIVALAERIGDKELALQGRTWRLIDLMGMGDTRTFDAEIDVHARYADELRQPRYLWFTANLRAMRALYAGRWQDAEGFAQQSLALGERTGDQFAAVSPLVQIFITRRERGRLAEEEIGAKFFAERYPTSPVPRTLLAIIYHDLDRLPEAREQFELLAAENFADLRRERRVGVLPYLSELCAAVGDRDRAAVLYELLSPYAHGIVPYGATVTFGAAAHYLALLAATMARWDTARDHFEYAVALHVRTGGRSWLAHSQFAYARFLLDDQPHADAARAAQLAESALAAARALEMTPLSAQAAALLERARHARLTPASDDESHRARAYGGGVATIEDAGAPHVPADAAADRDRNGKGRILSMAAKRRGARTQPQAPGHPPPAAAPLVARPAVPPRAAAAEEGIFRLDGEYWSVGDGTAILRLKDSKGLRYIAQLLRHPEREFHAPELAALDAPLPPITAPSPFEQLSSDQLGQLGMRRTTTGGTGEPLLDAPAKAAYRRRLEDLREHLEEATRFNDLERAAGARAEIEFITGELARAVGLRGRDRRASSPAERARLNVTRAIKAVIKRVSTRNPRLGRYLSTTIKTGTFCSYTPDVRGPIVWKL